MSSRRLLVRSAMGVLALALSGLGLPTRSISGQQFDLIIRNGLIVDGAGGEPFAGSVAVRGDRIGAVGSFAGADARVEVDAGGHVVAPGFINVLSWATESLIEDGRSQSNIRQGVTLEVMGEGVSAGPLNEEMRRRWMERQGDIRFEVTWSTLGGYLEFLERRGISPNVASFVGATTVRVRELGYQDRAPDAAELERMRDLVRQAMAEGALGVASALIYAPGFYARTGELTALARAAGESGGIYASHLRSEGTRLAEALDEFLTIVREARVPGHVYHLKTAGRENWSKLDAAFEAIESARAEGLKVTADIYPYTAAATGLDASMPPWVQEGGYAEWANRLRDPAIRSRVIESMRSEAADWENFYRAAGGAEGVLLNSFRNPALKKFTGMTLAEVAAARASSPEETAMDLVVEDGSRVGAAYFLMSEANVRRKIQRPWVSFGSDAASVAPAGVFLRSNPHPRAYGTFARVLGQYVREERLMPLPEAVRRMTSLAAESLGIRERGLIKEGYYADLVIFDPESIRDHATYASPHRYATGVRHVFVNGVQVLKDGEHTGAMPGRVVRGPGWAGRRDRRPE